VLVAVLAVHTHADGLLSVLAPLGLGAAAGTALVLDLDPSGVQLPSPTTVAEMISASPTLDQLRPTRSGLAVLASGGAAWDAGSELVEALGRNWPAVVVKVAEPVPLATVPVRPLMPGVAPSMTPAVYQQTGLPGGRAGEGIVLPRPGGRVIRQLMAGQASRGKWVRSWRAVWRRPWS